MTLKQALDRKVERVRRPAWNDRSYLVLPVRMGPNGEYHGPWCLLVDPISRRVDPTSSPFPVLVMEADDGQDDWEVYSGEVDPVEETRGGGLA